MKEYDKVISTMQREEETAEDEIYDELVYIKDRIGKSSQIMTDPKQTSFYFVLTPEDMIIEDTKKAGDLFAKFGVPMAGYIVNRVIPVDDLIGDIPPYLKNRVDMQKTCLGNIDTTFGKDVLARVPEFDNEIKGMDMIKRMAETMFGEKLA